jgi:general secretion pathway protein G
MRLPTNIPGGPDRFGNRICLGSAAAGSLARPDKRWWQYLLSGIAVSVLIIFVGQVGGIVYDILTCPCCDKNAKKKTATAQIQNCMTPIVTYFMDNSSYPTTEQGLQALVHAPATSPVPKNYPRDGYLAQIPKDPWGNDYVYVSRGPLGADYIIQSYGRDGKPGGMDDDADIDSKNLREKAGVK